MNRIEDSWGGGGHHVRHGSYEEYDHSDQEIYVYDQCCGNCRWLSDGFTSVCVNSDSEHCADFVMADDTCEHWKQKEEQQ